MNQPMLNTDFATALRAELVATVEGPNPEKRKVPRRLGAAGLGLLATAVGASFLMPGAYADWTATPQELDPHQSRAVVERCVEQHTEHFRRNPADPNSTHPEQWTAAVVERRGTWDFVLLTANSSHIADCLSSERGGGAGSFPEAGKQPARTSITVLAQRSSALDTTLWVSGPKAEGHHVLYGRAGTDIRSVVVHTEQAGDVAATVDNGFWVAWWPIANLGRNLRIADVHVKGATLTLADGTEIHVDQAGWEELHTS